MTDEELAEGWVTDNTGFNPKEPLGKIAIRTFLGGLKAGRPKWHKVADGDLPKTQGVYLVYRKKGYQYLAFDGAYWVTGIQDDLYNIIIAWCEIPTFTDKEEIMEKE